MQCLHVWYSGAEALADTERASRFREPVRIDVLLQSGTQEVESVLQTQLPEITDFILVTGDPKQGLEEWERVLEEVNRVRDRQGWNPITLSSQPGGLESTPDESDEGSTAAHHKAGPLPQYDETVLGGTFDHLHSGHKMMLQVSAYTARKILWIGVSSGVLLNKKSSASVLQSWDFRVLGIREFLALVCPGGVGFMESGLDVRCIELFDIYGPSLNPNIGAIVVSEETAKGGPAVNRKRAEMGRSEMDIHVVPLTR